MEVEPDNLKNVIITYLSEGEIKSFIKVWISGYASLCYCYFSGKILSKSAARLAAFLPVICLFLVLPLQLHSVHLCGTTSFFLTWLANFKLLMYAFDKGPLSNPSLSLVKFVAVACLPIKLQQQQDQEKPTHRKEHDLDRKVNKGHGSFFNYAIKGVLLALVLKIYDYEEHMIHPRIVMTMIYSFHVYLGLEILLAIAAAVGRGLLGVELEPQFNEPYLASSLQDFWGRRWNLMVTRILRPTVYLPVLEWSGRVLGRERAPAPAVMSTFVVSALMHELIFYYLVRLKPTWEITMFFVLHGACVIVEIQVKKAVKGRWRLPRVVGTAMTLGFVVVTGYWLFFPQLLRGKSVERALAELAAVRAFLRAVVRALSLTVKSNLTF